MSSLDEWMNAYRRTGGAMALLPTSCRVPPEVLFAFAGNNPERWQSLVGCQIRLLGKGFGEVVRVNGLTLWLRLEGERQGKNSTLYESVEVNVSKFEGSRIIGVLFPAGYQHVLVHTAAILEGKQIPSTASPKLPTTQVPLSKAPTEEIQPEIKIPPETLTKAPLPLSLPSKARVEAIKDFCHEREITYLVHFTRVENLDRILSYGLVGRAQVDKWRVQLGHDFPKVCEEERHFARGNAVCLSISFPNYKIFDEQRKRQGGKWVVIRLHASLLWELNCEFCQTHAANRSVRSIDISKRKSVDALSAMFANTADDLRGKLKIPDRYTTDPQAEVLVLETVPSEYIESIFYENATPNTGKKQASWPNTIMRMVDKRVFTPRIDSMHWQDGKLNLAFNAAPTGLPPASTNTVATGRADMPPKQAPSAPPKRPAILPTSPPTQPAPSIGKSDVTKRGKRPSPPLAAIAPANSRAKSPNRRTSKPPAKPLARNAPEQKPQLPSPEQVDKVHIRTIAKLWDMSLSDARNYVFRIQALCVKKLSYSSISAACRQLAYDRPTERDIAVRASELEGWSRRNVKLGSDEPGYNGQPQTLQSSSVTGRSKAGPKKIDRKNNDQQKINISKFGDWESD